jgi:hypothetical protein
LTLILIITVSVVLSLWVELAVALLVFGMANYIIWL